MYNRDTCNLIILLYFCIFIKDTIACPAGSTIIGDACFWVTPGEQTAASGDFICSSNGGGLALIKDQATSDAVKLYRTTRGDTYSEYFIGYKVTTVSGEFVVAYNGGGVQTYTNWRSSQPNSVFQECITIYGSDGTWYDESCTTTYKALCSNETYLPSETTTVLQTTPSPETTVTSITTTDTLTVTTTTTNADTTTTTTDAVTTTTNAVAATSTQTVTCTCQCSTPTNYISANMTKEIEKLVEKIKKELTVDKTTLSATTRKYISADDPRPSAAAVGSLGIVLLTVTFGFLIIQDIPTLFFAIKKILLRLKK